MKEGGDPFHFCLDECDQDAVRGWAVETADATAPVRFSVFIDNSPVCEVTCSERREDVVICHPGYPAICGFKFEIPAAFYDGQPHKLEFRTQDDTALPIQYLGNRISHFTFQDTLKPVVRGHVENIAAGVMRGGVARRDQLSGKMVGGLTILVTCEGEVVGQAKADRYRPDIAHRLGGFANCGFEFVPPHHFRSHRQQSFRFFLLPDMLEIDGSPLVTSFVQDRHEITLLECLHLVDDMYSKITRVREQIKAVLPSQLAANVDSYHDWAVRYQDSLRRRVAVERGRAGAGTQPLVSIVCPVYRPVVAEFEAAIQSVRGQTYHNWELIIVDDGSRMPELKASIDRFAAQDKRIKAISKKSNGGISSATNSAIRKVSGQWLAFFDHDDMLEDVALEIMVNAAQKSGAKLIYSDEDKIDPSGHFTQPALKPDWNYRYLLGVNYICHFVMLDTEVLHKVGDLRSAYDGAQDHDLLLRLAEFLQPQEIRHVPEILYHWRITDKSTAAGSEAKGYAADAGCRAIADHLRRIGKRGTVSAIMGTFYSVKWLFEEEPTVQVIVPFKDNAAITGQCIRSVLSCTEYANYELTLVDNWSTGHQTGKLCADLTEYHNVKLLHVEESFNYSRLNNLAKAESSSDFVLLLNNDVVITQPNWLRMMVNELLADAKAGIVGIKLLYPNQTVQHAGVVLGLHGVAGHVHAGLGPNTSGYMARAILAQELSAVTAACLLVRRSVLEDIGGLDEHKLAIAFNDVDLCLKARTRGWKIIWTPDVTLEHHESISRGADAEGAKLVRFRDETEVMKQRWNGLLQRDPFYSHHFDLNGIPFFDLAEPKETNCAETGCLEANCESKGRHGLRTAFSGKPSLAFDNQNHVAISERSTND